MSDELVPIARPIAMPTDADSTDVQLLALWLHGRAPGTIKAYRLESARLFAFTNKPLAYITLGDLQAFVDSLTGKPATRARTIAATKSLFSFASRLNAIPFNVAAALRAPAGRDGLADRILTEADVAKMLALCEGRDHALIRLAYAGGFRVSEIVNLKWKDFADASDGTLYATTLGKGSKTRTVRIPVATANILREMRHDAPLDAYVFPGRHGGIHPAHAWRIVRKVAIRAAIEKPVSPHFLRHAHASHALDRGVKVTVVRDTLGHSSIAITDRYAHARPDESSGLSLPV